MVSSFQDTVTKRKLMAIMITTTEVFKHLYLYFKVIISQVNRWSFQDVILIFLDALELLCSPFFLGDLSALRDSFMYHPDLGDGLGVGVAVAPLVYMLCRVLSMAHMDVSSPSWVAVHLAWQLAHVWLVLSDPVQYHACPYSSSPWSLQCSPGSSDPLVSSSFSQKALTQLIKFLDTFVSPLKTQEFLAAFSLPYWDEFSCLKKTFIYRKEFTYSLLFS